MNPVQHMCQSGWRMFDPLSRKLDVLTTANIFVKGVGDLDP